MTSTELFTPQPADDMLDEILPLVGAVPVYGPPIVLLVGPWLLLCLMLAGPFALLVTIVVFLAAAALVVALIGAILAAPYLLARHVRRSWTARAAMRAEAPRLVARGSQWGTA
jgi:hypothetical protein